MNHVCWLSCAEKIRQMIVAKKMIIPAVSVNLLSVTSFLPEDFFSSASIGTTGSFGVNFGPRYSAYSGTAIRTGHAPLKKCVGRNVMSWKP